MTRRSGDLCRFGQAPKPAHHITHYRCDDYPDGAVVDAMTGEVITPAPAGALQGFERETP